jgi:hypothetical protein
VISFVMQSSPAELRAMQETRTTEVAIAARISNYYLSQNRMALNSLDLCTLSIVRNSKQLEAIDVSSF